DRDRTRREPARRDRLRHRGVRPNAPAPASADRLLRELARARPRRARQPASRLPAYQQELRALLRLRGPLTVFVLLHRLQRLRRELDLPAPDRARSLALLR